MTDIYIRISVADWRNVTRDKHLVILRDIVDEATRKASQAADSHDVALIIRTEYPEIDGDNA